jgi:phosphatidylinositol 4-kinase A
MEMVRHIGIDNIGSRKSLYPKDELLALLVSNEQNRLQVWLFPLEIERRHTLVHAHHNPSEVSSPLGPNDFTLINTV